MGEEIRSLEGTVKAVLEKGNMPPDHSVGDDVWEIKQYTLFELLDNNSETVKIKFPMHLDLPVILNARIKYAKESSGCLDGRFNHVIEILDGPFKGLRYATGDIRFGTAIITDEDAEDTWERY